MSGNQKSPFDGFPATKIATSEDGLPSFKIRVQCLTPLRTKLADALALITMAALATGGVFYLPEQRIATGEATIALALAAPIASYPVLRATWRILIRNTTRLTLTTGEVHVKRWRGWESYDRSLPHTFALLPHDRTKKEQKRNEFLTRLASNEGEVISPPEYYGESAHLCLIHAGQRIDLTAIFGRETAQAVLARLQLCDSVLDNHVGMNNGLALSPDRQTASQPGDLP